MKPKRTLYLVVTERCNLKCDYCLYKKKNTVISSTIFRKGIDFFLGLNKKQNIIKEIYLFGGEPLLYPKLTQNILDYICGKYFYLIESGKLKVKILTNATLLNKKFYESLREFSNNFQIPFLEFTISFDGSIKTQDLHRGYGKLIVYKIRKILEY